jgi:hypothetical protein
LVEDEQLRVARSSPGTSVNVTEEVGQDGVERVGYLERWKMPNLRHEIQRSAGDRFSDRFCRGRGRIPVRCAGDDQRRA